MEGKRLLPVRAEGVLWEQRPVYWQSVWYTTVLRRRHTHCLESTERRSRAYLSTRQKTVRRREIPECWRVLRGKWCLYDIELEIIWKRFLWEECLYNSLVTITILWGKLHSQRFYGTTRCIGRINPVRRLRVSWCVSQYKCFNAFYQIWPLKGRKRVDGPLWQKGNAISSGGDWQMLLEWRIMGLIDRLRTTIMLRFIRSLIYLLNIDIDWCPFLEMIVVSNAFI